MVNQKINLIPKIRRTCVKSH